MILDKRFQATLFAAAFVFGFAATKPLSAADDARRFFSISINGNVIGYNMVLIVGGGWAVLGHLGIATGPSFLDIVNILWGMIILATLWTSTRRGIVGG